MQPIHDEKHGYRSPYVTARDPRFADRVADWARRGVLAPWRYRARRFDGPAFEDTHRERLVGCGSMRRLAADLAEGLDVRTEIRVAQIPAAGRGPLELVNADGEALGVFDAVVVSDSFGAVVVAGDGLLGPKVEAAWRSGVAAAERIMERPAP